MRRRWPTWLQPTWPNLRDGLMFFGGLAGVAHETLSARPDRPELLIVFGAMMGLPAFFRVDERSPRRKAKVPPRSRR